VAATAEAQQERPSTIGAVCRRLKEQFPDISISKIRYLEDQGLLAPGRTEGGYRLFTAEDVERLETILRLQRDEFLPLRVIKQELTSGAALKRGPTRPGLRASEDVIELAELCDRSGADGSFVRELEEYGLVQPQADEGTKLYPERDVDIVAACVRLARFGVEPRNLRSFRTGAERGAGLLEQVVAPSLRSHSAERRHEALEDLEMLAGLSQELSQLLFWRAVRAIVPR
jgi:DNA-binding transcriptional MerR regulator